MKNNIDTTALIFGSDTGITEEISNLISEKWRKTPLDLIEVSDISSEEFYKFDFLILSSCSKMKSPALSISFCSSLF